MLRVPPLSNGLPTLRPPPLLNGLLILNTPPLHTMHLALAVFEQIIANGIKAVALRNRTVFLRMMNTPGEHRRILSEDVFACKLSKE
jgi:hypothetical protein